MARRDQTTLGGAQGAFVTTNWTQLPEQSLDDFVRRYWKPVYCYLRTKGCDNERAKDLTQSFFQDVVMGRQLVQHADRSKGRFRTFLLTALNRYLISAIRAETAQKRMPRGGLVSVDEIEADHFVLPASLDSPEQAYHYAWASQLLDTVIQEVAEGCRHDGKGAYWEAFRLRVLQPMIEGGPEPPLDQICSAIGAATRTDVTNMIVTVKRRFRAALKRHVRQFVDREGDVDREIAELIEIFSASHAS